MGKEVYIIAGGNGCGKSTLAEKLVAQRGYPFLNADDIAKSLDNVSVDRVRVSAGKIFLENVSQSIQKGDTFILETTLSGKYLLRIIKTLRDNDYKITLVYVFLEAIESAINRVKVRVHKGGHNIPEEDIIRRSKRSKENFINIYKDLVDRWEIYYNGDNDLELISFSENNEVEILNDELYKKFNKL